MWPRMPRPELALLFPNGHSKYVPADGGPITPRDVKVAQSQFRDLAVQVAAFFHDRLTPGTSTTLVASARDQTSKTACRRRRVARRRSLAKWIYAAQCQSDHRARPFADRAQAVRPRKGGVAVTG